MFIKGDLLNFIQLWAYKISSSSYLFALFIYMHEFFVPVTDFEIERWEWGGVEEGGGKKGRIGLERHWSYLPLFTILIAMAASGIAVGINKGHITTRRTLKAKPSNKIGVSFKWMDGWMDI